MLSIKRISPDSDTPTTRTMLVFATDTNSRAAYLYSSGLSAAGGVFADHTMSVGCGPIRTVERISPFDV